ncbi:RHS repeat-associated core domain-containing protein [Pseudoxanthomonas sacheonensis]|uniref:RHS repeat-associated protein n=1 Tax=Pseudoxanthomonas sacheonensis TaxID=443615 RepID=A0ABU1RNF9_9GAMM|nr:RHS repeat-associated core domain-containing protein [Pseudoxanthomonas sacheonensis]MDR6840309.1 RHS repeat-associated protein [Pseudoxanthomonas sacheonensis]
MNCTLVVIRLGTFRAACLWAVLMLTAAAAQAAQPYQEYRKHIESAQTITALSDGLMGDSVSLYNGATEFAVTDISLPGNNALQVELRRRFSMEIVPGGSPGSSAGDPNYRGAGNWDIEVPYLSTTWGQTAWPNTRCSSPSFPSVPAPLTPTDGWQGNSVHLPGAGDRKLLSIGVSSVPQPTDGAAWIWTTRERDMVRCIPMQSGLAGEGFLLQTSDGLKFYFDMATTRYAGYINYQPGDGFQPVSFNRTRYYLLASRVEDRFGNWTTYSYNAAGHPTAIASSDGRSIVLTYTNGRLATATANGRTWSYAYGSSGDDNGMLTSVAQPDASQWQYAHAGTLFPDDGGLWDGNSNSSCGIKPPAVAAEFTFTVTHPSGAMGAFQFYNKRHPRSGVHINVCNQIVSNGQISYKLQVPNYFDVMSLTSKTLSGPGLSAQTWTYSYPFGSEPLWGTRGANQPYPCTTCASEKTVTVTEPDSTSKQYRYGYLYAANEGRLLGTTTLDAGGVARRVESTEYVSETEAPAQNFYGTYGIYGFGYGADDPSSVAVRPVKQQTVVQDGVTFTMQVNTGCGGGAVYCFDVYGRPTSLTKSNTLSYSKAETTVYHDNTTLWMLGQVTSSSVNGIVAAETGFDSLARPIWSKAFGKLQQTLTYYADGTVATVKDGNNNVTTLSSWKRGTPQSIKHPITAESPTGATQSAVVNDNGWITSITDENGYKTCYGYDTMGRVNLITYPSETTAGVCDNSAWTPTSITFTAAGNAAAYGMPAGHWRQTILTGNGRKILIFDALWRPVVEQTLDLGNVSGTLSEVIKRYDTQGRVEFQSYPMNTNGQANYTDTTLKGTFSEYDALDRVTSVSQDSELGLLTTLTEYLTGFKTRVTPPKGAAWQTTTSYQVYDQPTTDWPVNVLHPAGAVTNITRDVFGKPLTLRRQDTGNTLGITRSYTYNGYQELCRGVEPETGATLTGYDAAGNLKWSAAGLPAATACEANGTSASVAARRVDRTFDARNRVKTLNFPDTKGDQTWTYAPDGLVTQIGTTNPNVANPIVNTYNYNKRRLPTSETVNIAGGPFTQSYGYNANGHLLSQTYANTTAVNYAPNALGQPTQVGTYATGVSYYPNGAIKQFTYGNGIVHTMTQNMRQLPSRSTDCTLAGSCAAANQRLDLGYTFDKHANVSAITDYTSGARQTRGMTYDNLDRLTQTTSAMFGTASYGYDVLDNLTRVTVGASAQVAARDHFYCYNATSWQLTFIRTGSCSGAAVTTLGYDPQGNVDDKNDVDYVFDYGNRLRSAPGEWYAYDGHGRRVLSCTPAACDYQQYASNGQLSFHRDNRKGLDYVNLYLGGSLVAIREQPTAGGGAVAKYQHTDALGTPIATTDSAGNFIEKSEYEPYGKLINRPLTDGPGFTGHVQDAATGLTYMQQRYYDPGIGRFLSVDPVTADEDTGDNFNRYWYANNNPYVFTDPDGRFALDEKNEPPPPPPPPPITNEATVVVIGQRPIAPSPVAVPRPVSMPRPAPVPWPVIIEGTLARLTGPLMLIYAPHPCDGQPCGELVQQAAEHTSGARPSTKGKHQKGRARAKADKHGGEKGDDNRDPYGKKPPGHKGPWPPKDK